MLLQDSEWQGWSDREIARRCRVDKNVVLRARQSLVLSTSEPAPLTTDQQPRTYTTKHGTEAVMITSAPSSRPNPAAGEIAHARPACSQPASARPAGAPGRSADRVCLGLRAREPEPTSAACRSDLTARQGLATVWTWELESFCRTVAGREESAFGRLSVSCCFFWRPGQESNL